MAEGLSRSLPAGSPPPTLSRESPGPAAAPDSTNRRWLARRAGDARLGAALAERVDEGAELADVGAVEPQELGPGRGSHRLGQPRVGRDDDVGGVGAAKLLKRAHLRRV